ETPVRRRVSPLSDCPYHFIRSLVGGPTIAKQIAKAGREHRPLALRKSKDFSTSMSGGLFAPLEVVNFAIESTHISLYSCQVVLSPNLCHAHQLLNLQGRNEFDHLCVNFVKLHNAAPS